MSERKKVGTFSIDIGIRSNLFGLIPIKSKNVLSSTGPRLEIQWTLDSSLEIYKEKGDYTVYFDGVTVTVEREPLACAINDFIVGDGNIDFNNPAHVEWMRTRYSPRK